MCGRFSQYCEPETLARLFEVPETQIHVPAFRPRYNVAPSQPVMAVRSDDDGGRELVNLTWGLLPFWSKEPKTPYSTINARAETVAEKPAFRQPFRKRRCLIPADNFFEWKPEGAGKQPYFIGLKSGRPFAFAGLWDRWEDNGQAIESCTIIVTAANPLLRAIHERMPVILPKERHGPWLDPRLKPDDAKGLLLPYDPDEMIFYPISGRVNSPKNDDATLIERWNESQG
ncbi:MAG: SOS response-associated peptidase [Pseudomonadota bacterium]